MISNVLGWLWPVLLAVATWFSLEFIGKPFLRFQDIRAQVLRTMIRGTLGSIIPITSSGSREAAVSATREHAIKFKSDLAELSISLIAFKDTEFIATAVLSFLGYRIESAGLSAFALSMTKLPDDSGPIGGGDDRFEMMEGILRETLRLRVPQHIADKMQRDFDAYLKQASAKESES
jgi:hypothetical protein